MGFFGGDSLRDQVFKIEWEKKYGLWDRRLRSYGFVVAATFIFILFGVVYFTRQRNEQAMLSWNKVKPGDRLYANNYFMTDTSDRVFSFNRLIRPITINDVLKMTVSAARKRQLIAQLDTENTVKKMLDMSDVVLTKNRVFKHATALIGTFLERDSIASPVGSGNELKWYAFVPDERMVEHGYTVEIPKGYILANNYYYVEAAEVRLEEPDAIKKIKRVEQSTALLSTKNSLSKTSGRKIVKAGKLKKHKKKKRKINRQPTLSTDQSTINY